MVTWVNQLKENKVMKNKIKCKCGNTSDPNGNCDGSHLLKK